MTCVGRVASCVRCHVRLSHTMQGIVARGSVLSHSDMKQTPRNDGGNALSNFGLRKAET